jgi:drug/metabolite transporter (DMT)-like permease
MGRIVLSLRPAAHPSRLRGYGLALIAAAFWATGGLIAKWLFTPVSEQTVNWPVPPLGITIEPTALAGARALLAFVVMVVALGLTRRRELRIARRDVPFLALFGVCGLALVHFTYFKTISLTNVATAILLEYLAPIIVLAVGVLFFRRKVEWSLPVGVALSVTGSALVVGALGHNGLTISRAGLGWGLLAAVFFAVYSVIGPEFGAKRIPRDLDKTRHYVSCLVGVHFVAWPCWLVLSSRCRSDTTRSARHLRRFVRGRECADRVLGSQRGT